MIIIVILIITIALVVTPFLIVGFWRKKPIAAFIVAGLIMHLSFALPGIVKTYQAMMIYGVDLDGYDSELLLGGISDALISALGLSALGLPILAIFQWAVRRHYAKKVPKSAYDSDVP